MGEVVEEFVELSSLRKGRQYEIGCLGYCPQDDDVPPQYLDFTESLWWTIFHQPMDYNPRYPTHGMNEEFYYRVCRLLPKRLANFLHFFIAVDTSFDWWHGIDAFFFVNDRIVSIDVTMNPSKSRKADFLVTPVEMNPEEGWISPILVRNIANLIVKRCQEVEVI